jgi:hypothetical protein
MTSVENSKRESIDRSIVFLLASCIRRKSFFDAVLITKVFFSLLSLFRPKPDDYFESAESSGDEMPFSSEEEEEDQEFWDQDSF